MVKSNIVVPDVWIPIERYVTVEGAKYIIAMIHLMAGLCKV